MPSVHSGENVPLSPGAPEKTEGPERVSEPFASLMPRDARPVYLVAEVGIEPTTYGL